MSDHKWDRFKRAFGAAPSDDLVTTRSTKIGDELAKLVPILSRLTLEGLDGGTIVTRRQALNNRKTQALLLGTNKAKCDALDPIKDEARQLVAEAPGIADGRIQTLAGDLDRARKAISGPVSEAKALASDAIKATVAAELKTVEDASGHAEGLPDNKARYDALNVIDVQPLKDILVKAKKADRTIKSVNVMYRDATKNINSLPPGQEHDDLALELSPITHDRDDLDHQDDIDELSRIVAALGQELNKLLPKTTTAVTRYEKAQKELAKLQDELKAHRDRINAAIAEGQAVTFTTGLAVVQGPLDAIDLAAQAAEGKGTDQEKLDAYKLVDDKPLLLAIASARDIDSGVPVLLASLASVIGKLPDTNSKKQEMFNELLRLQGLAGPLATEPDLETARKGYAAIKTPATKLMDAALKAGGKDAYKEALKTRFGVEVTAKDGAKINLSGAYEMLALVPESHVGHDKLTKLNFTASKDGGGAYGEGAIDMDNFGAIDNMSYIYKVDGKTKMPNGFNVCMLHEIGHAVDDKYSIMAGLMDTDGYGNWHVEDKASVQKALFDAAVVDLKNPGNPVEKKVNDLIGEALGGADVRKPDELNPAQWTIAKKYTDMALAITVKKKPWFNAKPDSVKIGDRVYVQSYDKEWHSYKRTEYEKQNVRDYQWRAPGEWFADLYGVLWMTKKPAPSGVGPALARWLPA